MLLRNDQAVTLGYWVGIKNQDSVFIFLNDAFSGKGAKRTAAGCIFFITHGLFGPDAI